MALKGKKPQAIQKRLKVLFYGPAGVGKTMAAIQFPRPYLIDTERGAENDQYVRALDASGGAYMFTNDPEELLRELTALLSETHPYKTVVIDPATTIYNDLLDTAADQVGTDFGRHKGPANRRFKRMMNLLTRMDLNVILTSHAKPKWVRTKDARGKDTAVQEGITFDCFDGLDYMFDLVFEVMRRGEERVGIVRKSRIEAFPEGVVFPFNYASIAEKYGKELLERDAVPVVLATPERVVFLRDLIDKRKDGEDLLAAILRKATAETLEEMDAERVELAIAYIQGNEASPTAKEEK